MSKSKKYKAVGCNLYFCVEEEAHVYVADFFTEDGTFVESLSGSRDVVKYEDFFRYCQQYYGRILEGNWPF